MGRGFVPAGQWGTTGSVISWTFTIDGEKSVAKQVVEAIDEKKKSITFKVIQGDLLKFYEAFHIIFDVETNGEHDNLVTCTLEYGKQSSQVPDPTMFMDFFLDFSRDI